MRIVPVVLFTEILNHVLEHFDHPVREYQAMPPGQYHAHVMEAQRGLREANMAARLAARAGFLDNKLGKLYLRAARPNTEGQEAVGWHREEMYGAPKGTMNFWMPIWGVTRENTIKYIPGSEDAEIVTDDGFSSVVTKGSDGNEIGLLYAPKYIASGVDFSTAKPLEVPYGYGVVFSGSLIHGASENRGEDIRFSVDFRIYPDGY